jgi:hypothetical protein
MCDARAAFSFAVVLSYAPNQSLPWAEIFARLRFEWLEIGNIPAR